MSNSAVNADVAIEAGLRGSTLGSADAVVRDIPVVDLRQPTDVIEAALWTAANEVGFFTVVGHGISQEAIDDAFAASASFFAQERSDKEAQSPFARDLNSGYEYFSQVFAPYGRLSS